MPQRPEIVASREERLRRPAPSPELEASVRDLDEMVAAGHTQEAFKRWNELRKALPKPNSLLEHWYAAQVGWSSVPSLAHATAMRFKELFPNDINVLILQAQAMARINPKRALEQVSAIDAAFGTTARTRHLKATIADTEGTGLHTKQHARSPATADETLHLQKLAAQKLDDLQALQKVGDAATEDEMRELAAKLAELGAATPDIALYAGGWYATQDQVERAAEEYKLALAVLPQNEQLMLAAAWADWTLGNLGQAATTVRRVLAVNPTSLMASQYLMGIERAQGRKLGIRWTLLRCAYAHAKVTGRTGDGRRWPFKR